MLVLRRSDLETLLAPRDVVDALAEAFRRHAAGRTSVPPRGVTPVGDRGMLLVMPAPSPPDTWRAPTAAVWRASGPACRPASSSGASPPSLRSSASSCSDVMRRA